MNDFNWKKQLEIWSKKRIELLDERKKFKLVKEVRESGYFGLPGATKDEIFLTEKRLGVTLPLSYREFLQTSNGLYFSSELALQFYSVNDLAWYSDSYQDWIDELIESWQEPVPDEEYYLYNNEQSEFSFRPEYLQTALDISNEDDGVIFLLNPQVSTIDGEWEVWLCNFSTAFGVSRFTSFGEMMQIILNDPSFHLYVY